MINQSTANAITQYKTEERRARALLANGINILLQARRKRAIIEKSVMGSGIPELIEFYQSQLVINDPKDKPGSTTAGLNAIETLIGQLYDMVLAINSTAGNIVFPVEPIEK
jgi:hypothetical protein